MDTVANCDLTHLVSVIDICIFSWAVKCCKRKSEWREVHAEQQLLYLRRERILFSVPIIHPVFHQVEKAHPGVRAASERCGEDSSERQAVPRSGVCPWGAQEAHHVLHRRPRPPRPTASSHCLWAHPTLYQVTNHIIFSAGALVLALPLARAWPPPTPPEPRPPAPWLALQCYCWGSCCLEMYHRDERLRSLCYVTS